MSGDTLKQNPKSEIRNPKINRIFTLDFGTRSGDARKIFPRCCPIAGSLFNFHYCVPPDFVELNAGLNKPIGENATGFRGKKDFTA